MSTSMTILDVIAQYDIVQIETTDNVLSADNFATMDYSQQVITSEKVYLFELDNFTSRQSYSSDIFPTDFEHISSEINNYIDTSTVSMITQLAVDDTRVTSQCINCRTGSTISNVSLQAGLDQAQIIGITFAVVLTLLVLVVVASVYITRCCNIRHKAIYSSTDRDLNDYRTTLHRTRNKSPCSASPALCSNLTLNVDTSEPVTLRRHKSTLSEQHQQQQRFSVGPVMLISLNFEQEDDSDDRLISSARTYKEMYSVDSFRPVNSLIIELPTV